MEYLLLLLSSFTTSVGNILKKEYNKRSHGGAIFLGVMVATVACLFFLAINRDWSFKTEQLGYSFGFAASYCTSMVMGTLAIKTGPLAKTNLIISCSLLMPTFYGIIFLGDDIKATLIVGIVILVAALVMTNYKKSGSDTDDGRVSLHWLIFVLLSSIGNGMCASVQKAETLAFGDSGKNIFMAIALACVVAVLLILTLCVKSEREEIPHNFKCGWLIAVLCGVTNAVTNALTMYLNGIIPASVLFPVVSGVGMTLIYLYSIIFVKEKYTPIQHVGYALGVVSVVLLNL